MKFVLFAFLLLFLPDSALSAGLVTCDGSIASPCDFCAFMTMVNELIKWLFTILTLLAVMMMMYAGFKLVVSQGNSSAWGEAKGMLTNIIVGFVIVLAAWLIVDTLMKMLADSSAGLGMWNTLICGSTSANTSFGGPR